MAWCGMEKWLMVWGFGTAAQNFLASPPNIFYLKQKKYK
jgi:hypothetical protein